MFFGRGVVFLGLIVFCFGGCARSGSRGLGSKDAALDGSGELRDGQVDSNFDDASSGGDIGPMDAEQACGPATCAQGCCDQAGVCQPGVRDEVCGTGGLDCENCASQAAICHEQTCEEPAECNQGDEQPCGFCGTRHCGADGHWQPTCEDEGECQAGTHQDQGTCGNCGTMRRTCGQDCRYGSAECVDQGVCQPQTTDESGCDPCQFRLCGNDCSWGACQTHSEECNGRDDDCDGVCDNGFECCQGTSESCTTSCGSQGSHICSGSCTWGTCLPPAEVCNGVDDDCDGQTDEGHRADLDHVTYATLQGYQSLCAPGGWGLYCNSAVHRYCRDEASPCHISGFGPIEHTQTEFYLVCVADAELVETTYATLTAEDSDCNSSVGGADVCYSAIHRYCAHHGHVSGFGPVESSGENVSFACVNSATVVHSTYTVLSSYLSSCDGTHQTYGPECNAAINRYCQGNGYVSGFGPVEHFHDDVYFTCVTD